MVGEWVLKTADKLKKYGILLKIIFIFAMLSNLTEAGIVTSLCLACGLLCVGDLWSGEEISGCLTGKKWIFCGGAALISAAVTYWNRPSPETNGILLSLFEMGCTFLGGWILVFHVSKRIVYKPYAGLWMKRLGTGVLLRIAGILCWLLILQRTDSRFSVYILCGLAAVCCIVESTRNKPELSAGQMYVLAGASAVFSLAVMLANYPLFLPMSSWKVWIAGMAAFFGGTVVCWNSLTCVMNRFPVEVVAGERKHPARVFFLTAGVLTLLELSVLVFVTYPGILTRDSTTTIAQILGAKPYDNTMPFWHTMTVQFFVKLGLGLFGDINAAVALFHCTQILLMAATVGAVIVTLYQTGVPKAARVGVFCVYAFAPYNLVFGSTLWKDVPFACAAVLSAVGLFRLIRNVGRSRTGNYALLVFGTLGLSLWRTNGWYAFAAAFVVMVFLLRKKRKELLAIMGAVLLVCWILLNPVLDVLGVHGTDPVEAFAVPMQQVARVVAKGRALSEEETEQLSQIFDLEQVAQLYDPATVDPIKFEAFRREQKGYARDNAGAYLKLYLRLGLRYPGDYLQAWVEETKGFWNGGYEYWIYTLDSMEAHGIRQRVDNTVAARLIRSGLRLLGETEVMKVFSGIGLHVWCLMGCCVVNILKKREEFLLTIPFLVLILGLWLGTPVFCEFRYAYPVILAMPLIGCVTIFQKQ